MEYRKKVVGLHQQTITIMKNFKKSFNSFELFSPKYKSKSIKIDVDNYPDLGFVRFWIFIPFFYAITFKIYN